MTTLFDPPTEVGPLPCWVIRLPYTAPPVTANDARSTLHYYRQNASKRQVAFATLAAVRSAGVPRLDRCAITLAWYAPDYGTRDCDGLYPMLKACIDALTPARAAVAKGSPTKAGTPRKKAQAAKLGAGILADDNAEHVASTTTVIHLGSDDPRVELVIQQLEPLPPRVRRRR